MIQPILGPDGTPYIDAPDERAPDSVCWEQRFSIGVSLPVHVGVFDLEMEDGSRCKVTVDASHVPAVKVWIDEHPGAAIDDLIAFCESLDDAASDEGGGK